MSYAPPGDSCLGSPAVDVIVTFPALIFAPASVTGVLAWEPHQFNSKHSQPRGSVSSATRLTVPA